MREPDRPENAGKTGFFLGLVPLETRQQLEPLLPPGILARWCAEAGALAQQPEAQPAASALFSAAPFLAGLLSPRGFLRWTRYGRWLASRPSTAEVFFKNTPPVLQHIPGARLMTWARLPESLWPGRPWARPLPGPGQDLAHVYYSHSPALLGAAPLTALASLVDLAAPVALRSPERGRRLLECAAASFSSIPSSSIRRSLALSLDLAGSDPEWGSVFAESAWLLLSRLAPADQGRSLGVLAGLAAAGPRLAAEVISTAAALPDREMNTLGLVLPQAARVAPRSRAAALELLRHGGDVLLRLTPEQFDEWCRQGEELLRLHEGTGLSYFRLQSRQSKEALAMHSSSVALGEVRDVLRLYCQALMGKQVTVLGNENVDQEAGGWVTGEALGGDGGAIFAPAAIADFPNKEANFEAYKVLATHQAAHLEFGTYDFTYDAESLLFDSLRASLAAHVPLDRPYMAEFDRYFALFSHRRLAQDLFSLAEDARIDATILQEYRGIRGPYRRAQGHALAERSAPEALPLREHLVEVLVRFGLGALDSCRFPAPFASHLAVAASLVRVCRDQRPPVQEIAEAVLRLYVLLRQVPNLPAAAYPSDRWVDVSLDQPPYDPALEDLDLLVQAFHAANHVEDEPGAEDSQEQNGEQPYSGSPAVRHRGELRPEVMQAILLLQREGQAAADDGALGEVSLQDLAQQLMEYVEYADYTDAWGSLTESEGINPRLLLSGHLKSLTDPDWARQKASPLVESIAEPEVQVFQYDEWDYRTRAYRPAWCRLHERVLREGSEEPYEDILHKHPALVHAVRKQFEMLRPEAMGKIKRLEDGEEFDLDAVVESVVDKRVGGGRRDKVYWRRRRAERSVAVAVLLDLSLSTDERIDERYRFLHVAPDEAPAPTDWRNGSRPNPNKRIIEIEKEGLVLLVEALEQIGDTYGIFGFSGSGRADVQYYVLKELRDRYSPRLKARFDKLVPLQGTRMGPAIRHTVAKLAREEARTKVLMLLSDGRPQDRDYGTLPWELEGSQKLRYEPLESVLQLLGPDGVMTDEKEYAVHDTKAALNEAKAKHITPFCLSIDRDGHDYLKAMCGDIGYEVVSDIQSLPRRLPSLYRSLTT